MTNKIGILKIFPIIAGLFLTLALFIIAIDSAVAQTDWLDPVDLSGTAPGAHKRPVVAVDPTGGVHVVWTVEPGPDHEVPRPAVTYVAWDGNNWSPPLDITLSGSNPQLVAGQDGYLHLAWQDGASVMYAARHISSPNSAASWSAPVEVAKPESLHALYMTGDAAGVLHLVYIRRGDERGVYYHRSDDGGQTWTEPIKVSGFTAATQEQSNRVFAVNLLPGKDGLLHMVWEDDFSEESGLYYSRSVDGGDNWSAPLKIGDGSLPSLGIDQNDQLHLLYHGRPGDISCGRIERISQDDGATFSPPAHVLQPMQACLGWMNMVNDANGKLHLVSLAGNQDRFIQMYYASWLDNVWSRVQRIIPSVGVQDGLLWHQEGPDQSRLAISQGNTLHLVWLTNDGRVWYSRGQVDAPEIPLATLPAPTAVAVAGTDGDAAQDIQATPESELDAPSQVNLRIDTRRNEGLPANMELILPIIPVAFILLLIIVFRSRRVRR